MLKTKLKRVPTITKTPLFVPHIVYSILIVANGLHHPSFYVVLLVSILSAPLVSRLAEKYRRQSLDLMVGNLLYAGKGLSSRSLSALSLLFQLSIMGTTLVSGFALFYSLVLGFRQDLIALALVMAVVVLVVTLAPRLLIGFWASQRKVNVEVELPYVLILFRVMTDLRLPIYDVFKYIEESLVLRASSKEMKLARKVATMTSTSFISAVDTIFANHPSEKIRELVRRVVLAATTMGDVKDVVEKVFNDVYSWFEDKVEKLSEKFTIIIGSAIFAHMFIPIVVATLAPVVGGGLINVLIATLSLQVIVFFILYALITSLYPSSFVIKIPRGGLYSTLASYAIVLAILLYSILSSITGEYRVDEPTIALILMLSLLPATLISEVELSRVKLYDSFVRLASDALSLAAVTGENISSILGRLTRKYSKGVTKLTTNVLSGYASTALRGAIISRAPSIYHASFIETLTITLAYGSSPDTMRALSTSFEKLNTIVSRVRGLARMLEALMIGLSAMTGGFLAYINNVYAYIHELVVQAGAHGPTLGLVAYDPRIYGLLNSLSLLSIVLISMYTGKVRGGSVLFGLRPASLMILVYMASRYILSRSLFTW